MCDKKTAARHISNARCLLLKSKSKIKNLKQFIFLVILFSIPNIFPVYPGPSLLHRYRVCSGWIWQLYKLWEKLFYPEKFISLKIKYNLFWKVINRLHWHLLQDIGKHIEDIWFKKEKLAKIFSNKCSLFQLFTYFYALLASVDKKTKFVYHYLANPHHRK